MAREYFELPDTATFRDMILAIRADESMHREVNHYFSDLGPKDEVTEFDIHIIDSETHNIRISDSDKTSHHHNP